MSLNYNPLTAIRVIDPITDVTKINAYAILQGGNRISYKAFNTTSVSNSSIQFSCPPPSGNIIVDRRVFLMLPVRLTMTGTVVTNNGAYTPATSLVNAGFDAPRAFPLGGSIDTLSATINNDSVNINISDIIHAMTHYNIDSKLHAREYSQTPNYYDQSYNYSDLFGATRNPLGFWASGIEGNDIQRGAFPYTIVQNATVTPATGAGTVATTIVDMLICEPIWLSPFFFGNAAFDDQGFYNVNSMDFNFTFINSGMRMWSHNAISHVQDSGTGNFVTTNITNIQMSFNQFSPSFSYNQVVPQVLFKYITPNLISYPTLSPTMPNSYQYFDVLRYPTDFPAITYASGAQQFPSNNIQLSSIPRKMYAYIRPNNSVLRNRCDITDSYYAINQVAIQWANASVLLSSASQQQLYLTNVKNNYSGSWNEWAALGTYNSVFPPTAGAAQYGQGGGPLCFEFGTDIELEPDQAPGMLGQFQIQVNIQAANKNPGGQWDTLPVTMYLVFVMEGTFVIPALGAATHMLGVISKNDILDAQTRPAVTYRNIEHQYGGDFWSGLRDFGNKINDFLKSSKIISYIAPYIPLPGAAQVGQIAKRLGYGEGTHVGGIAIAGCENCGEGDGYLSKKQLKKNLMMR